MALEYDKKTERFSCDGIDVPRVTSVLESVGLCETIEELPPHVQDRYDYKSVVGKNAHLACHLYDTNRQGIDWSSIDSTTMPLLGQYMRFLKDTGFEVVQSEWRLFSKKFWFTGGVDKYGMLNGDPTIVDLKFTYAMKPWYAIQVNGAYRILANESLPRGQKIKRVLIVRIFPGGYELSAKKLFSPSDKAVFLSALSLVNYKRTKGRFYHV